MEVILAQWEEFAATLFLLRAAHPDRQIWSGSLTLSSAA
jgi:hypothetical protein